ncbi:PilZ domain-containing protein [Cellvibrio sp.]|uniref:PilZ domain-containing protein n=1 Tax=Cellvibrio sp. TaxID=1965322 RepID=UPI00396480B6
MTQERRRFSRIDFDARVEIAQGDKNWQAQLLDISLKGVLLAKLGPYQLEPDAPLLVKIILSDQTSIAMSAQVVHQRVDQLHLACITIDIDSISHLRRLIELNMGDAAAAERELTELIASAEEQR